MQAVYVFQKAAILSMLPEEEVSKLGENVVELFRCARENFYLCIQLVYKVCNHHTVTVTHGL